ncbi:MAG TPA: oligoendopeptidase F [Chthoniobacterales bacterium]|jgi:oligoendopeptidase F|nr:oligoendopeptidase F [Chthoniobacterales bacterium]
MSTTGQIPARSEIPKTDTWDLTQLFKSEEEYRSLFSALNDRYLKIVDFKGRLSESADMLLACLECERELDQIMERLQHYAGLKNAEDSSDTNNLSRRAELTNLLTKVSETASYITPEIQSIPDDLFQKFLDDPVLANWKIQLSKLRRFKPHTLSETEERLLTLGTPVIHGHSETFSQLTNVDLKFGVLKTKEGEELALSQSTILSFLHKQDRQLRRKAFHQFYQEFDDHKYTLASTLASSIRGDVFWAKVRNYASARHASLFGDNIPISVYDNLVATVRANLPVLHDYYELRRTILKLDDIHQYDTYVPLVPKVQTNVTFEQAIDVIVEALSPLGDEYVTELKRGLNSRWVDRYETKGKRSGAFSSSSYGNPPYILMNYKSDVFSDVFTLAHEAGHSMHSWFAQKHQLFQDYGYPIFLAEVASTFNEELLTHHLLKKAQNPAMRAYLIDRQIEDLRSVLFRQTMFAEFEKQIHEIEEKGGPITLDVFCNVYRELLEAYLGSRFAIDSELSLECLRIPHFYSAFYVYKYATGISAALSLAHRVLNGGQAEVDAYLGFLKSGGAKFPIDTLKDAGVDMQSPEPIEKAIALFARRLKELRELTDGM